jgi:hypothetical protein
MSNLNFIFIVASILVASAFGASAMTTQTQVPAADAPLSSNPTDTPVYDPTTVPTNDPYDVPQYDPYDQPTTAPQASSPANNTNCDEKAYIDCVRDGLNCIEGVQTRSDICECNQQASACLIGAGCGPGNPNWDKFYDACVNNDGCTAAQCNSASSFVRLIFGLVVAVSHAVWLI